MTKEKQPNFDFDEIDSEIVDLGVNQERQGALEQTANSISTFCADQDSTCQGPLAKPELVPDSIEGLDEVEKHKARIRQKRKVTRFAMTLIVLSMLVSSVLIQELWRVPDEDLGLSALPPRQHRQTKSVVKSDNDTPEWLEQWHNYFKDREWYNANAEIMSAEHKRRPRASPAEIAVIHTEDHTTLEQRKRHRQSEEKALKIVSEVVEKHGSQYILATLLQADSLVAIGRIDEWEKRDPRIILAPLHNRYEVYKKILGVANPRTLYALRDLGYCYERINDNAKAQSIFRYGLKISEESFGRWDTVTRDFASSLRSNVAMASEKCYEDPECVQLRRDYPHSSNPDNEVKLEMCRAGVPGQYEEFDEIYHNLLKSIAKKEGLKSKRLQHIADCYCSALAAQGRIAEAQKIRARITAQR